MLQFLINIVTADPSDVAQRTEHNQQRTHFQSC